MSSVVFFITYQRKGDIACILVKMLSVSEAIKRLCFSGL